VLHAQLLASESLGAVASLIPEGAEQLCEALKQRALDTMLQTFPLIADAALLAWPRAGTSGGGAGGGSNLPHKHHVSSTAGAKDMPNTAVPINTTQLLMDFRGLISSCTRMAGNLLCDGEYS
jgi:hypothetical protein